MMLVNVACVLEWPQHGGHQHTRVHASTVLCSRLHACCGLESAPCVRIDAVRNHFENAALAS